MNSTSTEIEEIISSIKNNGATGFRVLYDLLIERVYTYILARTNTKEEAQDCTQDSFIEIYNALPNFKYRSDAEFYGFVFLIVKRVLAKHYEKTKHKTEVVNEEVLNIASNEASSELKISISQILKKLDELSQEIIVLHYWSGYTFVEIASICNMTESAVRVRHLRAKAKLAELLEK